MSEQKDLLLGGGLLSLAGAKVMHTHFVTPPSIYGTDKASVDFKTVLLNSRTCVLSHCLIKEESPNLQLNSGS